MNEETFKAILEMEKAGIKITGGNKLPAYEAWKAEQEETNE